MKREDDISLRHFHDKISYQLQRLGFGGSILSPPARRSGPLFLGIYSFGWLGWKTLWFLLWLITIPTLHKSWSACLTDQLRQRTTFLHSRSCCKLMVSFLGISPFVSAHTFQDVFLSGIVHEVCTNAISPTKWRFVALSTAYDILHVLVVIESLILIWASFRFDILSLGKYWDDYFSNWMLSSFNSCYDWMESIMMLAKGLQNLCAVFPFICSFEIAFDNPKIFLLSLNSICERLSKIYKKYKFINIEIIV